MLIVVNRYRCHAEDINLISIENDFIPRSYSNTSLRNQARPEFSLSLISKSIDDEDVSFIISLFILFICFCFN